MLGSGIMVIGIVLAMSASVNAFRIAPDREFAVAAMVIAGTEALAAAMVVALSMAQPR
jgi:hypothetical protein